MSRRLASARIGYGGYSRTFTVPGDRRRFCAYARMRGLDYEFAELGQPYDVILLTVKSDLPGWAERKRREGDRLKLVFELVDSHLTGDDFLRRTLKGSARFLLGADSRLSPDYLQTLRTMCRSADAVLCSTVEQQELISEINPDVIISFDFFQNELGSAKTHYGRSSRLKLVWEGQAITLNNVQLIREPLNDLKDHVELHVVTDPVLYRYFGRFGATPALDLLRGIECPILFHPWEVGTFSERITACDTAIIPIKLHDPMMRGKPENKLVLLWQLGMPVLVGATPAYERAMAAAGIEMTCGSVPDWQDKIARLIEMPEAELEALATQGRRHALNAYSAAAFQASFDEAFRRLGFVVP